MRIIRFLEKLLWRIGFVPALMVFVCVLFPLGLVVIVAVWALTGRSLVERLEDMGERFITTLWGNTFPANNL